MREIEKSRKRVYIAIILILLVGLFLRSYRIVDVFTSNDEMDPIFHAMKTYSIEWDKENLLSLTSKNPIARLFVYPVSLGGIDTVLFWGIIGNNMLHLPITEFFWFFPFILMGIFSIFFIYLIVKRIKNEETALLVAAILSVLPIHVALSRFISQLIVAFFLNVVFVLFYLYYFETKQKKYLFLSSIALSLYIVSHNSFIGILPFVVYLPFVYGKKTLKNKLNFTMRTLLDWRLFMLPILTLIFLFIVHFGVVLTSGIVCYDLIGHTFSGSKTSLGFYLFKSIPAIFADIGIVMSILLLVSLYVGTRETIEMKKQAAIFILGVSYTVPYFILIPAGSTQIWAQIGHGLIWWVVYVGFLVPRIYSKIVNMKKAARTKIYNLFRLAFFAAIIVATLSTTFTQVYRQTLLFEDLKENPILKNGVYKSDSGAKAAGYWIRTYTSSDSVVFSDATGGSGIEPPIGEYYFNRMMIGKNDAKLNESMGIFEENQEKIDILVVRPENEDLFLNITNLKFYKALEIVDQNKPLLFIYSKDKYEFRIEELSNYNLLFDKTYNKLEDFINKDFINEEEEKMPYFIDKCSSTHLFKFYKTAGFIKE
jgi:hypothetical protein